MIALARCLAGGFQTAPPEGNPNRAYSFTEMRRQKPEFGETEVAAVREGEYVRGGSGIQRVLENFKGMSLSLAEQ